MSIFEKTKEGASRMDLRKVLKATPDYSPTNRMDAHTRVDLEEEIFPSAKYGQYISLREFDLRMAELNREMLGASDINKKTELSHKINLLKKIREM